MEAPMINSKLALEHLMNLLRLEGLTGKERPVADYIIRELLVFGCKPSWIAFDNANKKISPEHEMGNLIIKLPGTRRGARLLFSAHLDKVPLCRGAVPVRRGKRIVPKGKTALGGDDRAGVACLLTLAQTLLKGSVPYPPITFLFTVSEESGLWGARFVNKGMLGGPRFGFNFDGGSPRELEIGAVGAECWEVEIHGISAHAGCAPERGVSAALVLGRAVAEIKRRGFWGKIEKGKQQGTSNLGIVKGGEATNQVMDYLYVRGESRSHDPKFMRAITAKIQDAFEKAARTEKNSAGKTAWVDFTSSLSYSAYQLSPQSEVVSYVAALMRKRGVRPKLIISDGGLDANYLNEKGIPTVNFGAGNHNPHNLTEYVEVEEYLQACELALGLAAGD
jgi:tripeptide aminopeptidase